MAIMSETHNMVGLLSLTRLETHECAIGCHINSIPCTQKIGQLPVLRVIYLQLWLWTMPDIFKFTEVLLVTYHRERLCSSVCLPLS